MTLETVRPTETSRENITYFPTMAEVLVEKSPEELKRSKMAQLAALVRHEKITAEHIIAGTREINYSLLGEEFQSGGKYDDLRIHLKAKQHKFNPRSKLMRTVKEIETPEEPEDEEPEEIPESLSPPQATAEPPLLSAVPEVAEVTSLLVTVEAGIGVLINLKERIKEVEAAGSHLGIGEGVAVVDTVKELEKKDRCYQGMLRHRSSSLDEVADMDIYLRKDSLHPNRHQGRNRFWQNLKESFDTSSRRLVRKAIPYALLLAVGATAYATVANGYLDWVLNPARPMANDEAAHLMVSNLPTAMELDVVLPAAAAEPINSEPLAKVEPPADVLKEVTVQGSIAQTLLNQGFPVHWQPGDLHFESTIARFEQLGDDNFLKLQEFNRNMGGSYFPASKAEFHILANQARIDADARQQFYGLFGSWGADNKLIVRSQAQNSNTSASSAETSN